MYVYERYFFKLISGYVFGKTIGNLRKHRDVRLVTMTRKRSWLAAECNYYITKWFTERLLTIVIGKTEVEKNKWCS